jgi:hypothetical protein
LFYDVFVYNYQKETGFLLPDNQMVKDDIKIHVCKTIVVSPVRDRDG